MGEWQTRSTVSGEWLLACCRFESYPFSFESNRTEQVILQDQEGVLAWVSERLAVAMRQAEDLILRDYILSAASVINAGGGNNGRVIAVVKSSLVDLELLAA